MGRTQVLQSHQECIEKQEDVPRSANMLYSSAEEDDEETGLEPHAKDHKLSSEVCMFQNQVAGHSNDGKHFGIVKFKEALLKPISNAVNFEREALFYERLQGVRGGGAVACACEPDVLIKRLVPKYYGRSEVQLNGTCVQCLVLEDLTRGMREPCIMDVKIGRRTWDPNATLEKIHHEDAKYCDTKREYGFCIPGFQVYDVKTGALKKFDKVYGKQLNKNTINDALRTFLNGRDKAISRILLVQLLVDLWHIQRWARKQYCHRLYSSSILLIYDARRLRQMLEKTPAQSPPAPPPTPTPETIGPGLRRTNSLYRPLSLAILNDKCTKTGFSGQLNQEGPIFPCRITKRVPSLSPPAEAGRRSAASLKRMHSFQNNYDEELRSIRTDYASILEDLVTESHSELWAAARMIDFSHAFTADERCRPDVNYLDGLSSLVQMLENFLVESDG